MQPLTLLTGGQGREAITINGLFGQVESAGKKPVGTHKSTQTSGS
jgi:hypothetical protein